MGQCYTYQSILTTDGTNICLIDTGTKRGEWALLWGRTILTHKALQLYSKGKAWYPMMSRPLHISPSGTCHFHPQKQSTTGPLTPPTGPLCQSHKSSSCWSSALKIPTFSSKVSIVNRSMGSPMSLLITNLFMDEFEAKAISSAPIHPGSGLGVCKASLSSKRLNTVTSSSRIITLLTPTSCSQ